MKKLIFSLISIGFISQMFAQDIKLPEVIISAVNYKYLNSVNSEDSDIIVKQMQQKAALYNIKESDIYEDDYDYYTVSFFIPEGKFLAAYDKDGVLLRTIEKFEDIKLPKDVRDAVFERYPNWTLDKDVYYVNYNTNMNPKKVYKLKLRNGKEVIRIKVDTEGNIM